MLLKAPTTIALKLVIFCKYETNKCVIFDFNGVLWWDSHLHEEAWRDFSERVRGTALSDEEMLHQVHGRTNRDILEYLVGREISSGELEHYTHEKESIYRELCLKQGENFKLAPGAIEFLDYLKENDIPHTIATASEINNLKFFFKNLDLSYWFDFDTTVYDDGTIKGKPAPDIYLKAAAKLNLDPSECLVIEDSRSGIAAAHSAGIGTIVALGPKEKHSSLAELPGVTRTIVDFYELLPLIKEQYE